MLAVFETGVRYQFLHAITLLFVGQHAADAVVAERDVIELEPPRHSQPNLSRPTCPGSDK